MFKPFESSTLLVHIAFHYVEDRIKYLKMILDAIDRYDFQKIDVVIDTNVANKHIIDDTFKKISPRYSVHDNLEDPFLLTWQHRANMAKSIDHYDYFMYLEDDILVPYEALQRWKSDSEYLYPAGYLRGFLRVEETREKTLVSTDQQYEARLKQILHMNKRKFYRPSNPYQAFWIYSRHQMKEFVKSQTWKDGNRPWLGIRERASSGMTWRNTAKHATVIPLDGDYTIPGDVLVWHVANSYADNSTSLFGKIAVANLVRFGALSKTILRMRGFFGWLFAHGKTFCVE